MYKGLGRIVIAVTAAILLVLTAAGVAHAQNWNSGQETGLTSLTWDVTGNLYTWNLTNNSGLASDPYGSFDILIWSLMPYRVREPLSWTAPEGWTWNGRSMELASNSGKYMTPFALGPGQTMTFTYLIDPEGDYINSSSPIDDRMYFNAHVGAVIPNSGSLDGSDRWEEYYVQNLGQTWHDRAWVRPDDDINVIPEPGGWLALSLGACGLLAAGARRRRS